MTRFVARLTLLQSKRERAISPSWKKKSVRAAANACITKRVSMTLLRGEHVGEQGDAKPKNAMGRCSECLVPCRENTFFIMHETLS
jgi:hypothetical protein